MNFHNGCRHGNVIISVTSAHKFFGSTRARNKSNRILRWERTDKRADPTTTIFTTGFGWRRQNHTRARWRTANYTYAYTSYYTGNIMTMIRHAHSVCVCVKPIESYARNGVSVRTRVHRVCILYEIRKEVENTKTISSMTNRTQHSMWLTSRLRKHYMCIHIYLYKYIMVFICRYASHYPFELILMCARRMRRRSRDFLSRTDGRQLFPCTFTYIGNRMCSPIKGTSVTRVRRSFFLPKTLW